MTAIFFGLLIGLEIKHFIADYLMQPGWILGGKGDVMKLGGYAHAGIHGIFSVVVLLIFGTPLWLVAVLFVAEASSTTCSTSPRSTIRAASTSKRMPAATGRCTGSTSCSTS